MRMLMVMMITLTLIPIPIPFLLIVVVVGLSRGVESLGVGGDGSNAEGKGISYYARMETVMIELTRPRYPPYTPMDVMEGNLKILGGHAGEDIFIKTELALDWLLSRIINGDMQKYLVEGVMPPLPNSVSSFLVDLVKSEDGRLLRFLLRTMARHKVYPQIGEFFVKLSMENGMAYLTDKVLDVYGDTFLRMKSKDLIYLILGLVQERAPPDLFLKVVKASRDQLPTTITVDIFTRIVHFQRVDRFLEYFIVLLKNFPRELNKIDGVTVKSSPEKYRFWELRRLDGLFNFREGLDLEGYQKDYYETMKEYSKVIKDSLWQVDWYLGRSNLFQSCVKSDDDLANELMVWTIDQLKVKSDWRTITKFDMVNVSWIVGFLKVATSATMSIDDCHFIAAYGSPALLSALLAFSDCPQGMSELAKNVSEARGPGLTDNARRYSRIQKLFILRLLPEARRVSQLLGEYPREICGTFGSAIQSIEVDLDWLDFELSTNADMVEVILAFVETAFLIPRVLLLSLETLPNMPSIIDWINSIVIQYCFSFNHDEKQRRRPIIRLIPKERLPLPKWYQENFSKGRYSTTNQVIL